MQGFKCLYTWFGSCSSYGKTQILGPDTQQSCFCVSGTPLTGSLFGHHWGPLVDFWAQGEPTRGTLWWVNKADGGVRGADPQSWLWGFQFLPPEQVPGWREPRLSGVLNRRVHTQHPHLVPSIVWHLPCLKGEWMTLKVMWSGHQNPHLPVHL